MNISGNTILITGGGSGIGRGLAEALHAEGNQVIIAGRRQSVLDETVKANPGMKSVTLDIEDAAGLPAFAEKLVAEFPMLNAVILNAGIMRAENLSEAAHLADAEAIINTNLLGPIRLLAVLLPHFLKQPQATVATVSSGLAFVPLAPTPTYNATKAAIHSYTQSLRYQLRKTTVEVLEIIPPYVQTELMGGAEDPRAMPLKEFIAETIQILKQQPTPAEISVDRVKPLRYAAESGHYDQVFHGLNEAMAGSH
ncbi:SDR family oxidoreductase [Silvibacterium sp.]|uniref:SDR family oxidoreductase n=1 Tax=Silvibacterium sp. TaxID=1964179 RepID=UPI0039E37118